MSDRSLAKIDTAAVLMRGSLTDMVEGAKTLLRSGLLPEQVNTPEKAVVIMLKGQELGIPPMEAMSRINVIKGKPSLSASLMAALVERAYGPKALIVEEATNDHCTVSVWKPGWDKRRTITFSMGDAKQAGIATHMYQKYPRAMLRSRAISEACETYFQSIVGGLYTPEELGDDPAEEDYIDHTPAVQTEVVTEAQWIPYEDDGDDRVDTSTGEIIEAEAREVDDEPSPPGDDAEFFSLVRDLNKLLSDDDQLPSVKDGLYDIPLFAKCKKPEDRVVVLKRALVTNLKQWIDSMGDDQTQLNAVHKDWGDHAAWPTIADYWQQRMELSEIAV